MPIEKYITGNEKIQIKEIREGKKLVLECEDKTEYYCPYCGSYKLRCKDTFIINIKRVRSECDGISLMNHRQFLMSVSVNSFDFLFFFLHLI